MLDENNDVKVADFGIGRFLTGSRVAQTCQVGVSVSPSLLSCLITRKLMDRLLSTWPQKLWQENLILRNVIFGRLDVLFMSFAP